MIDPLLIELPKCVETPRLLMRPPQAGDGVALHAAVVESLPELRRFLASLPWVATDPTVESSEIYCRNGQANFMARKDLTFLLFEKATGYCGVAYLTAHIKLMDFCLGQGVKRSNSSTIARLYNAAMGKKTQFYVPDSVQHHTSCWAKLGCTALRGARQRPRWATGAHRKGTKRVHQRGRAGPHPFCFQPPSCREGATDHR